MLDLPICCPVLLILRKNARVRVDFSVSVEIAGGLEGLRYLFTKMNEIFAIIFVIWQSSLIMTKAMFKKNKTKQEEQVTSTVLTW